MNNTRAINLLSLLSVGWIGILFIESTRPSAEFLGILPQLDKVAHFCAFAILGLLLCGLSLILKPKPSIPLLSMPLIVVTLCGIAEESLQMIIPGRMASIADLLADIGGVVFAIMLANFLRRFGIMRLSCKH